MKKLALVALLTGLAALTSVTSAPAVVPPRDCGFIKLKGHRYNVKADQMRCSDAKDDLRDYALRGKRPGKGWTCKTYKDQSLRYRCYKGQREFFGIRRS
jgi:hypothetical protein